MTAVGYRPILWHLMKYYAHFGHKDFILCLGYRADVIKNYFLNYNEAISNDFVLTGGGAEVELLASDINDWRITFVDTGMTASVGERLRAVRPYLEGEDMFLANYADGLSDLDLDKYVEKAFESGKIDPVKETELWVNGGFFVFRKEIFDYLGLGEDLVNEPFARLIGGRELFAYRYEGGFWLGMDTFKDRMQLEDMYASGYAPWQLWDPSQLTPPR
jgi:glucose-1-phosphate cytidylyltransferase